MSIAERWDRHPPLPSDLSARLPRVSRRLREGGAKLVYVFGSAAAGTDPGAPGAPGARSPQDLDVAVWGLEEDRWLVQADVAEILGTDRIDLVLLEEAEPELRYRIISSGRLLHAADRELENRIESRILREYQDLAPFRRVQADYLRARNSRDGS